MDVEALSGPALSHWTGNKEWYTRSLTLHLRGKTIGSTAFNISLRGPVSLLVSRVGLLHAL